MSRGGEEREEGEMGQHEVGEVATLEAVNSNFHFHVRKLNFDSEKISREKTDMDSKQRNRFNLI